MQQRMYADPEGMDKVPHQAHDQNVLFFTVIAGFGSAARVSDREGGAGADPGGGGGGMGGAGKGIDMGAYVNANPMPNLQMQ